MYDCQQILSSQPIISKLENQNIKSTQFQFQDNINQEFQTKSQQQRPEGQISSKSIKTKILQNYFAELTFPINKPVAVFRHAPTSLFQRSIKYAQLVESAPPKKITDSDFKYHQIWHRTTNDQNIPNEEKLNVPKERKNKKKVENENNISKS